MSQKVLGGVILLKSVETSFVKEWVLSLNKDFKIELRLLLVVSMNLNLTSLNVGICPYKEGDND
jgi:hypothetical protein